MTVAVYKGVPWELRGRGMKDSLRHDQRVKEAIRKNLRELIAEEAIISSDGNKRVRIPLRYLEQYRFKYGHPQSGVGQGAGKPGDLLGQRTGNGDGPGSGLPGDEPGELTYEVEMLLDDLTQMMLEDMALPWLEEKHLRFKIWEDYPEKHANAAVYMLMDRSGSMTTAKKYIAKSFFFWMVRFLRLKYQHVETVFIAHDTEAQVVPETDFFALSNSGGTKCSSAYKVALEHIIEFHPESGWNVYLFHFSDGDNLPYDNAVCKTIVEDLLVHCNMVGYGEIHYRDEASFYGGTAQSPYATSTLQYALQQITHPRLMSVTITHKEELYQVLQSFLQPKEVVAV
ncbi:MAG: DUF444 family protein [Candidatus Colwellbacteria bacterium]|nr:DUF444 family protein [Candidatus Colwellbacteria bacterium]